LRQGAANGRFSVNDSSRGWDIKDLQTYQIFNAKATTLTSSHVTIEGTNVLGLPVKYTITGNFYSTGYSVAGTVNTISLDINNSSAFSVTGLSVSYRNYANTFGDAFTDDVTKGSDVFNVNSTRSSNWDLGAGNDTINSGSGNDTIDGGSGTDTYVANGALRNFDVQNVGSGIQLTGPNNETDYLRNFERIEFSDGTINVANGTVGANAISFVSDVDAALVYGGSGNDTLEGGNASDTLVGGDDNDRLIGGSHDDQLIGGSGDDHLTGQNGHDSLSGGTGQDTLKGGTGYDTLKGGEGSDSLDGSDGKDKLSGGSGRDTLNGGNHNDKLVGDGGNDVLRGGNGDDFLRGKSGRDELTGGNGNDRLLGDSGRDILLGHKGDDRLTGGKQSDTFVFHKGHGNDTITDFTIGSDHIEIGRGASRLKHLDFSQQGDDVLVAFSNVTILVEDTTVAQLQDADNFLF
jgi:Ca2+-binding RTX toxin-like protein